MRCSLSASLEGYRVGTSAHRRTHGPPNMEVTLDKWQKWVSALIEGDDCVVANLNSAADDLERKIKMQKKRNKINDLIK